MDRLPRTTHYVSVFSFLTTQIHKHKIWERISFQRSQILDEVICVEVHDLGQHRNDIGISGLRPRTIWIVSARNNLERTIFYREVCMFETKHLADPHTRLEREAPQRFQGACGTGKSCGRLRESDQW